MKTHVLSACFGSGLIVALAALWWVSDSGSNTSRTSSTALVSSQFVTSKTSTLRTDSNAPSSVSELAAALKTATTRDEKAALCDQLITLGSDEALQAWSNAVHAERDPSVRLHMAAALDALSSSTGLELVTSALAFATDETVLDAVNRTISRTAEAETVAHLTELVNQPELRPGQQARALAALSHIENHAATAALAQAATSSEFAVRKASAASLALIGTPEAAQGLIQARASLPAGSLIELSTLLHHLSQMPAAAPLLRASADPVLQGLFGN
jgi:HEAT repeat protein